MSYATIRTRRHTVDAERGLQVGVLTLYRPERLNAFSATMAREMIAALEDFDADPAVRAIVLQGEGRAFCAGADIEGGFAGSVQGADHPPVVDGVMRDAGGWLNLAIWEVDTAVVAAAHGAAVGIGFTMLLPADYVVAAEGTKMSVPFTRRGIVFDGAASWFLPRIVGLATARDWALTGRTFRAEDAYRAGLVRQLEPDAAAARARALEVATDIALNCAPQSVALNKRLMRLSLNSAAELWPIHMEESRLLGARFASPDCAEGVSSFFEKRAPKFAANVLDRTPDPTPD